MKNKKVKQMIEDLNCNLDPTGCMNFDLPWYHSERVNSQSHNICRGQRILAKVKKITDDETWKTIENEIRVLDATWGHEITFSKGGHWEPDYGYYVDQYSNGGDTGDSFAGQLWFPITKKRFLTFHYSC